MQKSVNLCPFSHRLFGLLPMADGKFCVEQLWMGTHPSLPSRDVETQRTLLDLVQDNLALMSIEVSERYAGMLPFLFKVLSIRKALSIQAHPNKKLAEKLHAQDPKNYPGELGQMHSHSHPATNSDGAPFILDDNHKPEMTIAITPFEGLCGFRPLAEIAHFLSTVKPLRKLIGDEAASQFEKIIKGAEESHDEETVQRNKDALRTIFTSLMQSTPESIETAAKDLVAAAKSSPQSFEPPVGSTADSSDKNSELASVITRLNGQFPNDIGLFVFFFLNFVKLQPGEAMFLKADDIHAYISGDIIECMAASDNVVRAGFTPKFKDVSTLTEMLTYSYAPIEEQKLAPTDYPYVVFNAAAYTSGSSALLYDPPIDEFSVVKTDLKQRRAKATFEPIAGPSIFICTQGQGRITVGNKTEDVREGYVFFVGANAECIIESTASDSGAGDVDIVDDDEVFTTYKAFCDLAGKEDTASGE